MGAQYHILSRTSQGKLGKHRVENSESEVKVKVQSLPSLDETYPGCQHNGGWAKTKRRIWNVPIVETETSGECLTSSPQQMLISIACIISSALIQAP